MMPIAVPGTNSVFRLEGCGDLPAIQAHDENGQDYIISAWEISPEELRKLNQTGIIYLSVMGHGQPPVALTVDNPVIGVKLE